MSLEQEGLVITFVYIVSCWILLEGTSSKDVVMFTFNNVESRCLVANKPSEVSIGEVLL